MKTVLAVTALALFGLAPATGSACEIDDSSASAAPPAQLGLAPAPAATQAPAATIAKALAPKAAKTVVGKVKAPTPDAKLAAAIIK